MDDLIRRQAAIDTLHMDTSIIPYKKAREYADATISEIRNRLEKLPPAEPEIIRCKDCKHKYIEDGIWHCPFGLMGGEDFYCGYGSLGRAERRTDE